MKFYFYLSTNRNNILKTLKRTFFNELIRLFYTGKWQVVNWNIFSYVVSNWLVLCGTGSFFNDEKGCVFSSDKFCYICRNFWSQFSENVKIVIFRKILEIWNPMQSSSYSISDQNLLKFKHYKFNNHSLHFQLNIRTEIPRLVLRSREPIQTRH